MESYESERWGRLEADYEKIFPKPEAPWYRAAINRAKEEASKLSPKSYGEAFDNYGAAVIKNLLDYAAVYMMSNPSEYKEYQKKIEIWKKDREMWVRNKIKEGRI